MALGSVSLRYNGFPVCLALARLEGVLLMKTFSFGPSLQGFLPS